jgi:hypothetical protein
LVGAEPAFAYVDPASGSYFFQFLLAAVLGGLVAVKLSWRRLKGKLISLFSTKAKADDSETD